MNEVLENAKTEVINAEKRLKDAKNMLEILRKTGEDTSELQRKVQHAESKLRRYKTALEME